MQTYTIFQDKESNHIYFAAALEAAKRGAELASGDAEERIYIVG